MKIIISLSFLLFGAAASSSASNTISNNKPIHIAGSFKNQIQKKKEIRELMEQKTNQMVKKQIELIQLRQELKLRKELTKRIENL